MELFYADSSRPIRDFGFTDTIFADDLNSFKGYAKSIVDKYIVQEMHKCQKVLSYVGECKWSGIRSSERIFRNY